MILNGSVEGKSGLGHAHQPAPACDRRSRTLPTRLRGESGQCGLRGDVAVLVVPLSLVFHAVEDFFALH
jgi:hypothetical protein